uniref:Uncharacterized protein n=1 Tax=Leersia perrieri TaxID=77586 RepID=A0A0D9VRA6_9ORYZ
MRCGEEVDGFDDTLSSFDDDWWWTGGSSQSGGILLKGKHDLSFISKDKCLNASMAASKE